MNRSASCPVIGRPIPADAPDYCAYFFSLATEDHLLESLENTRKETIELIRNVPAPLENYRYRPDKWTIKMVFSHITECERLYSFYAACYSRKEHRRYELLDPNWFADHGRSDDRTLQEIGEEFWAVREATIHLFRYLTDDMLDFRSNVNSFAFTPRSLGWMISGHDRHHCKVVESIYLHQ